MGCCAAAAAVNEEAEIIFMKIKYFLGITNLPRLKGAAGCCPTLLLPTVDGTGELVESDPVNLFSLKLF